MTWCKHCGKDRQTGRDDVTGSVYCTECGRVISQDLYENDETTFVKGPGGESRLAGNYVKIFGDDSDSHRRTLEKGNSFIDELIDQFGITDVKTVTKAFYRIAVERGFTKGRRTSQVAAACLYIACREKAKWFLLIDFSSHLSISVYELGAVYLQLCRLLSLENHEFIQQPVDPSLYMHRFTSTLIKGNSKKVLQTALQFIASMKRDWMQTGRKPSGICGVALYVSTIVHGLKISKSDIIKVVHICEATLTKRLIEFENTKSGSLTIEEFNQNAEEYEKEIQVCKQSHINLKELGGDEVPCEHKGEGARSGSGLCNICYLEFCGGLEGGLDPPAFQRAEAEILSCASAEVATESNFDLGPRKEKCRVENEENLVTEAHKDTRQNVKACLSGPTNASGVPGNENTIEEDHMDSFKDMPDNVDETDTLSDIDDAEVDSYLNNEEESHFKKIIWEEMNKEHIQEQAAKEAAAAAARKLSSDTSDEVRSAQELAATAKANVAKLKEKRRQKRAEEAKNTAPAQTAKESTRQMLTRKKLSTKVNYKALDELFPDDIEPTAKKSKGNDGESSKTTGKQQDKNETEEIGNFDDQNEEDEDLLGNDLDGEENDPSYYGNEQEMYNSDYNEQEEDDDH